jgi:hypothetical protein
MMSKPQPDPSLMGDFSALTAHIDVFLARVVALSKSEAMPVGELTPILKMLRECQRLMHAMNPDAFQAFINVRGELESKLACRELAAKVWQSTTLK